MTEQNDRFSAQLRLELRHRLRPMTGRDSAERARQTTPIELFFDLIFVVGFAAAASQLADAVGEGHLWSGLGAYAFAIFAISWAWMNYTWFASAYGNDDVLFRIATLVQILGVVILVFGLPQSFSATAHGHSPNDLTMVIGYVVMRIPQVALWIRAAQQDPSHRRIAIIRVLTITLAQLGWLLTVLIPAPLGVTVAALILLAAFEMIVPAVIERRLGSVPWNAGHVAERFGLLTLIALGELVSATVAAVSLLVADRGWSVVSVALVGSGVILAMGFWWAYYLIPSRTVLERWPDRVFIWRYAHLPIFGSVTAVGAGVQVAAVAVDRARLTIGQVALALSIPTAVMIAMIFVTWTVLMRSFDFAHLPLALASFVPLVAAIIVGFSGPSGRIHAQDPADVRTLVVVIALVTLSPVIEVVGHELVGLEHTMRVIERDL